MSKNSKKYKTMRTTIWHLLLFGLTADLMDKSHVDYDELKTILRWVEN